LENLELLFNRVTPVIIFVLMFSMGLSLTVAEFRRLVAYPKAVIVGLAGQLLLLPVLAFSLTLLFGAPPVIAAGAVLLAACPGGVTSNSYVFVSRGDVGLSVTLTALTSILTVVTIPLIASFTMGYFFESGAEGVSVPIPSVLRTLAFLTALPLSIGMAVIHIWPQLIERALEFARRVSLVLLITLIIGVTIGTMDTLREHFFRAAALAVCLNVAGLCAGYALGRWFKLPELQVRTMAFEIGVQNIGIAVLVGATLIGRPELATFTIVYALIMKVTSLTLVYHWRRSNLEYAAKAEAAND
jgi:BASS family bile acid:Na+ symporter